MNITNEELEILLEKRVSEKVKCYEDTIGSLEAINDSLMDRIVELVTIVDKKNEIVSALQNKKTKEVNREVID